MPEAKTDAPKTLVDEFALSILTAEQRAAEWEKRKQECIRMMEERENEPVKDDKDQRRIGESDE